MAPNVLILINLLSNTGLRQYNFTLTIPGAGLDPVQRVEQSRGAAVAGVRRIDSLNVCVPRVLKQLHEDRLDTLRLVNDGLRTDLQTPDVL